MRLLGDIPTEDIPSLMSGRGRACPPFARGGVWVARHRGDGRGAPVLTSSTSALAEVAAARLDLVDPVDEDAMTAAFIRL